jgi:hypothetical protein
MTVPQITPLSTPPTRSDPTNFATRADTFLSELPNFGTQANTLASAVNGYANNAASSETNAAASAAGAVAASGVSIWISGTTYSIGDVRFSPITFLSYRRKTAGTGTTDPSADSTNWALVAGTGDVTTNGTQTLSNKTLIAPVVNQATLTLPTSTAAREIRLSMPANNFDLSQGNYFTKTISTATTFTVSNVPSSGIAVAFILDVTNAGSAAITWFSGVQWQGGIAPVLTAIGRDVLGFFTHDAGTTWNGLVLAKDIK